MKEKVESGLNQTASEVVHEALRLLKERDQAREQLRADGPQASRSCGSHEEVVGAIAEGLRSFTVENYVISYATRATS